MEKLIPVDTKRCQAEKAEGCHPTAQQFMALGPAQWVRCSNKPVWIATENKPPKKGLRRGTMSLCDNCKAIFIETKREGFATLHKIT